MMFRLKMGRKLNLDNPQTFSEKLQWLKLYDRKSIYTTMVDKFAVKQYVADIIGKEYIIPTLGVWDSFDEIDFDKLPNQFVLKTTHSGGSTGVVICRDKNKFDFDKAKRKLNYSLKSDIYMGFREWPYKNVPKRIIAEKYLKSEFGELRDFKFFCFDGCAKFLEVISDRERIDTETKLDFFDIDFNLLPFIQKWPNSEGNIQRPLIFDEMNSIAEALSQDIPHVRVDLYEVDGMLYFGELTFFHWSGLVPFTPQEWDKTLGDMINLPKFS